MTTLTFLKLGGSLITNKAKEETARLDVIKRLAIEIAEALRTQPESRLLIGHGSGSFGHVAANRYGTRHGIRDSSGWPGFAEVSVVAARLNTIVLESLHEAGIAAMRFQPSASAVCLDTDIRSMQVEPIQLALENRIVPVVYGDVAFDRKQGGTIISTEEIFMYLATHLRPARILLAGRDNGVLDQRGRVIPAITPLSLHAVQEALGDAATTDVTGGMASKVYSMLELCKRIPGLEIRIFSGEEPGAITSALSGMSIDGTIIRNA